MRQEQWQTLYKEAVLETDRDKLKERIRIAEAAIAARSSLDGQVPTEDGPHFKMHEQRYKF
jgi:hypothetical protein